MNRQSNSTLRYECDETFSDECADELQNEPKASDVITLVKKTFFRTSIE